MARRRRNFFILAIFRKTRIVLTFPSFRKIEFMEDSFDVNATNAQTPTRRKTDRAEHDTATGISQQQCIHHRRDIRHD